MPLVVPLLVPFLVGAAAGGAQAPQASPGGEHRGGEARDALVLTVRTNSVAGVDVRVRAGEPVLRTYRLVNRAEYGLAATLTDSQVAGGVVACGRSGPVTVPALGTVDCAVRITAAPGVRTGSAAVDAVAPAGLPRAVASEQVGYHGVTAGLALSRVGVVSGSGVGRRTRAMAEDSAVPVPDAGVGRAGSAHRAGGSMEARYRVEAVGEVPVGRVSVVDDLPGLGAASCPGLAGGQLLVPGHPADCAAAGSAKAGRQQGTAHAVGFADDAVVGEDGHRLPGRRLSADAPGSYDGAVPGSGGGGTGTGGSSGGNGGSGSGSGGSGAGAGSGQGQGQGQGQGAGPGAGQAQAQGQGPAQDKASATGQASSVVVPYRPGAGPAPLPGGPFAAVPPGGLPGGLPAGLPGNSTAAQGGAAAVRAGLAAAVASAAGAVLPGGAAGVSGAGAGTNPAAGRTPVPGQSAGPAAGASARAASAAPTGAVARAGGMPAVEGSPFGSDDEDTWGADEVMLMLLAILLPVLCVLAAAFTVRPRTPN